ncbi:MAG: hypothetical protein H6729_04745 [Deltaproteobacteria bacterium]|nr:hypothetical protein [Deltaproteobacteria bacterium]
MSAFFRGPLFLGVLTCLFAGGAAEIDAFAAAKKNPKPALTQDDDVVIKEAVRGLELVAAWRVSEARAIAERLHVEHPEHPLTLALVAEVKLNMSDYAGAVDFFDRAARAGAPKQVLFERTAAEAAERELASYEERVSDRFVVRYRPGKDEVIVPAAIETLERAEEKIGALFDWRPSDRIVLELYPSANTLAEVSSLTREDIKNSGTIALCRWNRLMVTTPRAVVFGYAWRDTIAHELTHLIIGGASKNTVPIWLHEGLAKFAETAWRAEPGLGISEEQQRTLREAARKGTLIPFERMHPSMAKLKSQEETSLAFAEVFTFIEFLVETKGWEGIRSLLHRLSEGATEAAAVKAVYGKTLPALFEQWSKRVKNRPIKRPRGEVKGSRKLLVKERSDTPDDALEGLTKEGRRYARAADLLYARGRLKAAKAELEKAFRTTGSPLISAKLATVALAVGDMEAAERAARAAIDGTHEFAGPYVTLAEILIYNKKPAEALEALEHAVGVNPFDPRIYSLSAAAYGALGDASRAKASTEAHAQLLGARAGEWVGPAGLGLGEGATIVVDATPFYRVFVRSDHESGPWIPAAAVTPTAPISIRPGSFELMLVPPMGEPRRQSVVIAPSAPGRDVQRITLSGETAALGSGDGTRMVE